MVSQCKAIQDYNEGFSVDTLHRYFEGFCLTGRNIDSFIDTLADSIDYTHIYFHNLSFDGNFIIKNLLKRNYKQKLKIGKYDRYVFEIFGDLNKMIKLRIRFLEHEVSIQCSYVKFNASVSTLSEMCQHHRHKLTNLVVDYTHLVYSNSLLYYCIVDNCIVNEYYDIFMSNIPGYLQDRLSYSGIAKKEFEEMVAEEDIKNNNVYIRKYANGKTKAMSKTLANLKLSNRDYDHLMNLSMVRGGLTTYNEAYRRKIVTTGVICYDVNSLYPHIFSQYTCDGRIIYDRQYLRVGVNYWEFYEISLSRFKIKPQYQGIEILKIKGVVLDEGDYTECPIVFGMLKEEWDLTIQLFDDVSYATNSFWIKKSQLAKGYVAKYNKQKEFGAQKYLETGDPYYKFLKDNGKLMSNGCVGKYAQRDHDSIIWTGTMKELEKITKKPIKSYITKKDGFVDNFFEVEFKEDRKTHGYLPINILVTSLGRCYILRVILALTNRYFISADTDSFKFDVRKFMVERNRLTYTNQDVEAELQKIQNFTFDPVRLGDWKYELTTDMFIQLANKQYIYEKKGKIVYNVCGLTKKVVEEWTKANRDTELVNKLLNGDPIEGGKVLRLCDSNGISLSSTVFQIRLKDGDKKVEYKG